MQRYISTSRGAQNHRAGQVFIPLLLFIFLVAVSGCSTHFVQPDSQGHRGAVTAVSKTDREALRTEAATAPSVENLKQSGWWTTVQKNIREQEYHITRQKCSFLPEIETAYHAPNRAQNLRTYFTSKGIILTSRMQQKSPWHVRLIPAGIGRGDKITSLTEDTEPIVNGTRIEYHRGTVTEWYDNRPEGLEQGFQLKEKSEGEGGLSLLVRTEGNLNPHISHDSRRIDFLADGNVRIMQYGALTAFDAEKKPLKSRFELAGTTIRMVIDDAGAVYPITVDPLITSPAWTAEGNQDGAYFGCSVGTAGDVNGDGYSDIIVGAYGYDNGETNEGMAFVYTGSASGLSDTAAWTAEGNQDSAYFGCSVGTAGDVNGDGYSDIIVGAYVYDNGETNEGMAFVYTGSASGLSDTAAWTAEGNQDSAYFGLAVGTAGDVNGDGFSDVIVGAQGYTNGMPSEGIAFLYYGSASGLSTTAAWTAEGNVAVACFGHSVGTAGDVNGDGYDDVIVGADKFSNGESDEGMAFLYYGSAAGLSATAEWMVEGNQEYSNLGCSVGTAGDVNGDGYDDVIIGAFAYENGEYCEGMAFVY
jgi:hypothetical protein